MRKQDEEEEGEKDVAVAAVGRVEEEEEKRKEGGGGEEEEEEEDGGAAQLEDSADCFFESLDRVPSGVSLDFDLPSSGSSSDDDEDDVRISFASAVGAPSFRRISSFSADDEEDEASDGRRGVPPVGVGSASVGVGENYDYGIWMAEPISVKERRRKLLQGMGLASRKEVPVPVRNNTSRRIPSRSRSRLISSRFSFISSSTSSSSSPSTDPIATASSVPDGPTPSSSSSSSSSSSLLPVTHSSSLPPVTHSSSSSITTTTTTTTTIVARSQSDSQLFMMRNPAITMGSSSFQRRSSSLPSSFGRVATAVRGGEGGGGGRGNGHIKDTISPGSCKIKNLDTGKEFVVSEKDGTVGRVNDGQTGLQLTMEEFEKFLGFSPIVKELMRRANLIGSGDKDKKKCSDNDITAGGATTPSKSSSSKHSSSNGGSNSSRKRGGWLKNIKFVASSVTGLISDKERENTNNNNNSNNSASSSERMKVHQHGKSYKELTGLYMCQEIQAHQGSIWTIKFSWDSRYLASAGEDRVVHVWEVLECDTLSSPLRCQDQTQSFAQKPPLPNGSSTQSSKKTKKGKVSSANRRNSLPDYIVMPETVFSLSQKPVCSFEGHLDDVLDLSWSKSQYLLSSSMDKTVRLWDMETKACLKLFAHNDYVTCIQFNPIDDRYFISGSLDAKVRIWSIPDRHVVDWTDLHEMATAACYTPDGQGALVGSHKGSCRFYNTSDCKLCQEGQIDIRNKKKKSNAKKITGFQFAPDNPSEVLITSADSQIRVFNGVDMIHKFRGFRNTSSQISASCSLDGKYVVCASEDSHVYIWKRDTLRNASAGGKSKGWLTTRSHEHFYCKDVSVAIPWPCGGSNYEPSPSLPSWPRRHTGDLPSDLEDSFSSSSRSDECPPLPKKSFSGELHVPSGSGSGIGSSSFVSSSASLSSGSGSGGASSLSSSASSSLSSSGRGGNSNRISSGLEAANAWGLVVVTAGLDGNIRVYQNFGMPLRLSRQPNLF